MQGSTPRFDVRDYFRIVQKRKWFIILVGLAAMLIGGLYAVSYPKVYRASSLVLVRQKPAGIFWVTSGSGRNDEGEIAIETQASMIMSGELAEKVALALREKRTGILTDEAEVRAALRASSMPPDRIRIDAESPIENHAIAFANEAAEQFLVMNTDFRREEDKLARQYLDEQLKRAEKQLDGLDRELIDFRNEMGVYTEDAGAETITQTMAYYRKIGADVDAELAATRGQMQAIDKMLSMAESDLHRMQSIPNPTVGLLRTQLTSSQVALSELRSRYQDAHPAVQELQSRIETLRSEIAAAPSKVSVPYGSVGGGSSVLSHQRDALSAREADLVARGEAVKAFLTDLEDELRELPARQSKLYRLRSRAVLLEEARSRILQQLEIRQLEEQAKGGTAMVLDTATNATSASPSVSRGLLFSAVLGLVAGIALALVLEALDDTIHSPEDLQRETEVTFLGMVPLLDTGVDELITISAPKSPPAESYRTLRSNVNFSMVEEPAREFLVTSAGSGEGKTVTAANLAVVFAQAGQSVILVDTDLRRPSLHRLLHCDSSRGLTNVLVGEASIEDVLQDTHVEGLRLISSGPLPPNPAEMLDSSAMERFLKDVGDHADVVMYDSPPAIVLTDAVVLSSKVQRTILVAESGQVTREAFAEAVRLITKARGTILGVILNKLRLSASDYYYYYYYYDYSRETPRVISSPRNGT